MCSSFPSCLQLRLCSILWSVSIGKSLLLLLLLLLLFLLLLLLLLQSNPFNTDTEGTAESVRINGVSLLSRSWYQNKKKHLSLQQNTKEVKEDISTVKLNFPNLQKAVITRLNCAKTP